jgi:galactoside O-acetyltransferase
MEFYQDCLKKVTHKMINFLLSKLHPNKNRVNIGFRSSLNWKKIGSLRGTLKIGADSIIQCRVDFDSPDGLVTIGDKTYIGASHLVCKSLIEIGTDVIISWGVTIVDHDSHSLNWSIRKYDVTNWISGIKHWDGINCASVKIQNKVWIGFGATILKGVTIGEGAVVAAQSVITKDIPPYTLAAGNPARIVRNLNDMPIDEHIK